MQKSLRYASATLLLLTCSVGSSACWNVVGQRLEMGPDQLATEAREAHARGDRLAAITLLERLIADYPDSDAAQWARGQLQEMESQRKELLYRTAP